jgi:hypothetical protein
MTHATAILLACLWVDAGVGQDPGLPAWLPRLRPVTAIRRQTYPMQPQGQGYVYEDPRFEARIAPDGVVAFTNRQAPISLFPFSWIASLPPLREPTLDPWKPLEPSTYTSRPWRPLPGQLLTPRHQLELSQICPAGTSSCGFPPTANMISVGGSWDLTDEMMAGLGQDPNALAKARFLSATFEFRMKLAAEASAAEMKTALLVELPATLDRIWADRRYTARERRRILYEVWYQTDRTPAGQRAAKTIAIFIQERLPCGSPDAYTAAELQAFARAHPDRPFPVETCEPAPR